MTESPSSSTTPQLAALPAVPCVVPDPAADYEPMRRIFTEADIPNWLDSEAYYHIELLIARLSVAVDGKTVEDPCHESEVSTSRHKMQHARGRVVLPTERPS